VSAERLAQLLIRTSSTQLLGVVAVQVSPSDVARYGFSDPDKRGWRALYSADEHPASAPVPPLGGGHPAVRSRRIHELFLHGATALVAIVVALGIACRYQAELGAGPRDSCSESCLCRASSSAPATS